MKIKELVELIGVLEPIKVLNGEFDVIETAMAKDLSPEILNKNIKPFYADNSAVSIIIK